MRVLTFNVNSLQRLLGHPLHHIVKPRAAEGEGVAALAVPLRTQADIDAHTASLAAAARERATLLSALTSSASSSGPSSAASGARLRSLLDALQADLICLQEVKMARAKLPSAWALVEGYDAFFAFSKRKQGYSGVVTFCKKPATPTVAAESGAAAATPIASCVPLRAEEGLTGIMLPPEVREPSAAAAAAGAASASGSVRTSAGTAAVPAAAFASSLGEYSDLYAQLDASTLKEIDSEGRCVLTDHGQFVLINVYCPAHTSDDPARAQFRSDFQRALQVRAESLVRSGRHVIIVGDLNACSERIDHADFSTHAKLKGNMFQIRKTAAAASASVPNQQPDSTPGTAADAAASGGVESREPTFEEHASRMWLRGMLQTGARHTNYGTRIDYVLADSALVDQGYFTACDIRPDIQCSDHCPVQADFNAVTLCTDPTRQPPPLCSRWMPEFSGSQQKLQSFFKKGPAAAATAATTSTLPRSASAAIPSSSPTASSATLGAPGAPPPSNSLKRPHSLNSASASSSSNSSPASKKARNGSSAGGGGGATAANKNGTSAPISLNMRDFFTAKAPAAPAAPIATPTEVAPASKAAAASPAPAASSPAAAAIPTAVSSTLASSPPPSAASTASTASPASVSAPSAWAALLDQKSPVVTCRCGHTCKLLTVTKQGANQGRKFYVCPTPPPGRCDFFMWATQTGAAGYKANTKTG